MRVYTVFAYVDIFPQHQPLGGRKCLIFGDFEKHSDFSSLKTRVVDYTITGLSVNFTSEEFRSMILDFGIWVHKQPMHYGVILPADFALDRGSVVSLALTVPMLDGF